LGTVMMRVRVKEKTVDEVSKRRVESSLCSLWKINLRYLGSDAVMRMKSGTELGSRSNDLE
jgi:hypothetical protein